METQEQLMQNIFSHDLFYEFNKICFKKHFFAQNIHNILFNNDTENLIARRFLHFLKLMNPTF